MEGKTGKRKYRLFPRDRDTLNQLYKMPLGEINSKLSITIKKNPRFTLLYTNVYLDNIIRILENYKINFYIIF